MYAKCAEPVVTDILKGYNGTIFAYGQTGSGKSYTMFGLDREDPLTKGVIPRASTAIFDSIRSDATDTEYTLQVSFLEIYRENIHDLLNPGASENLNIREHPTRGIYVENLSEEYVTSEKDIYDLLAIGEQSRSVASTRMNSVSSRSHSVFTILVSQRDREGCTKTGKLNLVDLAGSEKVGKTGAEGQTLEEAKKINQSLSALGNCIAALVDSSRTHVPYRDSKLTRILQESLGGNTKTTLMVCASPHEYNAEETVSTLRFGQRAKSIKTTVRINKMLSPEQLMAIIEELRTELAALKKHNLALEKELRRYRDDPNAVMRDIEDEDDYNPIAAAKAKVELEAFRAEANNKIDQLTTELQEAKEREEEQADLMKVLKEKAAAHDILMRKYRNRSSTADAEAESLARQNALELHAKRLELATVKGEVEELKSREEALMQVAEDQEGELQKAQEERDDALMRLKLSDVDLAGARDEAEKLRQRLHAADTLASERGSALEAQTARAAELEAALASRAAEVRALEAQVADLRAADAATQARLGAAESELASTKASLEVAGRERDVAREERAAKAIEDERALETTKATLQGEIDAARDEAAKTAARLSEAQTALAKTQATVEERDAALATAAKEHAELAASLAQAKERGEALAADLGTTKGSLADATALCEKRAAEVKDLKEANEAVRKERDDAQQARVATAKEGELAQLKLEEDLRRQVDAARDDVRVAHVKIADTEAELKKSRGETADKAAALEAALGNLARESKDLEDVRARARALEADLAEGKAKLAGATADIAQRDAQIADLQAAGDRARKERDEAREEKAAQIREADAQRAEAERASEKALAAARADTAAVQASLRDAQGELKKSQLEAADLQVRVKTLSAKLELQQEEEQRLHKSIADGVVHIDDLIIIILYIYINSHFIHIILITQPQTA